MKVEYLLQLWKSFNKKIWSNKRFALFLYTFIILGTVLLRPSPHLYYSFLEHPLFLTSLIIVIILLAMQNITLGIILTVALLALYYPSHSKLTLEGFEDDDEDETKVVDPSDTNIDEDDETDGKESNENESNEDEDEDKDSTVNVNGLEDLSPDFYINKSKKKKNIKKSKKKNNEDEEGDEEDGSQGDDESEENEDPSPTSSGKSKKKKDSFLGEVREVFYDLDAGRKDMNVKNAVKKITDLVYHTRRSEVEKILQEEDSGSDTSSDEDYF